MKRQDHPRHVLVSGLDDTLLGEPEASRSDSKVSYHYPDAEAADLQRIEDRLEDAGLNIPLIYSSRRDLDILPHDVNQGSALFNLRVIPGPAALMLGSTREGKDMDRNQEAFPCRSSD